MLQTLSVFLKYQKRQNILRGSEFQDQKRPKKLENSRFLGLFRRGNPKILPAAQMSLARAASKLESLRRRISTQTHRMSTTFSFSLQMPQ